MHKMPIVKIHKKRKQHCTFCKNHGLHEPKKGHQCQYLNCQCVLCSLTQKAQILMRHQQRVWRHQKQKLKDQSFEEGMSGETRLIKSQACDKCRNHNFIRMKRNHLCPYQECKCNYCSLTFKRREVMKHQQRVRRSNLTSQKDGEITKCDNREESEFSYRRHEHGNVACDIPGLSLPQNSQSNYMQVTDRFNESAASLLLQQMLLRSSISSNILPEVSEASNDSSLLNPIANSPPPLIEISSNITKQDISTNPSSPPMLIKTESLEVEDYSPVPPCYQIDDQERVESREEPTFSFFKSLSPQNHCSKSQDYQNILPTPNANDNCATTWSYNTQQSLLTSLILSSSLRNFSFSNNHLFDPQPYHQNFQPNFIPSSQVPNYFGSNYSH